MPTKPPKRQIPAWARALRTRRESLDLTQDELADRTNGIVAQRTVSNLETARTHIKDMTAERLFALARALDWTMPAVQESIGINLGQLEAGPPSSLEYTPDGAYIRLRGLVSGGSGEPEEMDGELFFVPRHILKKYNVRTPETELAGYMVNGNSMFYASEGVRARGLKSGDLIAVHRSLRPSAETPMVVAWDKQDEKMLVKLLEEDEEWVVFRSVNSSANPPITRRRDEVHFYGTVIMRITSEP